MARKNKASVGESWGAIESFLRPQLEGELLRWAVGRAITCPGCGRVLDCRRAVLADSPSQGSAVACSECWDKAKAHVLARVPHLEVTDGRDIEW